MRLVIYPRYLRGFKNIQPVVFFRRISSNQVLKAPCLVGNFSWGRRDEFFWWFALPVSFFSTNLRTGLQPKFHGKFPAMEGWWRFIAFGDSHNQKVCQLCNMSSRSSSTFWDSKKKHSCPPPSSWWITSVTSQIPQVTSQISIAQKQRALRNQRWTRFEGHLLRSVGGYHGNLATQMWNNTHVEDTRSVSSCFC